ncbi:alkaline phosphatase family protein [Ruania albidiflava]|uniref:alkaline phosphatase family protein n=1 Tax=Ruania albidiflava TaxID=366586 RepID=UPI0003B4A504|nr:alkaline phosphatase family protein [Ruania albidiflava]
MSATATHVLLIGIDGVRHDTFAEVPTPHLDAIGAAGLHRPVLVHPDVPTISGPSWATMLTGVLPASHRILDNDLTGNELAAHPDVVHRATSHRPGMQTFVGADWQPLVTNHSGGPLLAGGGFLPDCPRGSDAGPADWHCADQLVVDAAADALSGFTSGPGSVSFVYLHGCDTAGHHSGVGPLYRELIAASDQRVGQLLHALEARSSRAEEDWLVIAATDHGHRPEGGHGGDTDAERTAWISACGPGVPTGGSAPLELADVAGHVSHVLGLPPRSEAFIGLPFGARAALRPGAAAPGPGRAGESC